MKAYEYLLEPLNGPQEWPHYDSLVRPSKLKKVQNRAKTKKRLQTIKVTRSGKMKKVGIVMTCSSCGIQGHNKRGCKNVGSDNTGPPTNTEQGITNTSPMHNRGVGVYTYPNGC